MEPVILHSVFIYLSFDPPVWFRVDAVALREGRTIVRWIESPGWERRVLFTVNTTKENVFLSSSSKLLPPYRKEFLAHTIYKAVLIEACRAFLRKRTNALSMEIPFWFGTVHDITILLDLKVYRYNGDRVTQAQVHRPKVSLVDSRLFQRQTAINDISNTTHGLLGEKCEGSFRTLMVAFSFWTRAEMNDRLANIPHPQGQQRSQKLTTGSICAISNS